METIVNALPLVLSIGAYVPYIWGLLKQGKQTAKRSWLVFLVANTVTLVAMLVQGQVAPQVIAYEIGIIAIFLIVCRRPAPAWSRIEKLVIAIAVTAAVSGLFLGPQATIVGCMIAVSIGSIPLFKMLWGNPDGEPRVAWALFLIGSIIYLFNLGPVSGWTIMTALAPVVFLLQQITVLVLGIPFRPRT